MQLSDYATYDSASGTWTPKDPDKWRVSKTEEGDISVSSVPKTYVYDKYAGEATVDERQYSPEQYYFSSSGTLKRKVERGVYTYEGGRRRTQRRAYDRATYEYNPDGSYTVRENVQVQHTTKGGRSRTKIQAKERYYEKIDQETAKKEAVRRAEKMKTQDVQARPQIQYDEKGERMYDRGTPFQRKGADVYDVEYLGKTYPTSAKRFKPQEYQVDKRKYIEAIDKERALQKQFLAQQKSTPVYGADAPFSDTQVTYAEGEWKKISSMSPTQKELYYSAKEGAILRTSELPTWKSLFGTEVNVTDISYRKGPLSLQLYGKLTTYTDPLFERAQKGFGKAYDIARTKAGASDATVAQIGTASGLALARGPIEEFGFQTLKLVSHPIKTTKEMFSGVKTVAKEPGLIGQSLREDPGSAATFVSATTMTGPFAKLLQRKGRDLYVKTGSTEVSASDVFASEVLTEKTTFPMSKDPGDALRQFEAVKTPEGKYPVIHATATEFDRTPEILGVAGTMEDKGLFVTPKGRASPYFLRSGDDLPSYELSANPLNLLVAEKPQLVATELYRVQPFPGDILKKAKKGGKVDFGEVNTYLDEMRDSGTGTITARSTVGQTREVEATFQASKGVVKSKPASIIGKIKGFDEYVVYGGRAVPIKEFRFVEGKMSKGSPLLKDTKVDIAKAQREIKEISIRQATYRRSRAKRTAQVPYSFLSGRQTRSVISYAPRPASSLVPSGTSRSPVSSSRAISSISSSIIPSSRKESSRRDSRVGRSYYSPYIDRTPSYFPRSFSREVRGVSSGVSRGSGYTPPPPPPTTYLTPFIPKKSPGKIVSLLKDPFKVSTKTRYTPSATAVYFGIKGKPTKIGIKSGIGLRPIKKPKKRRKKK